MNEVVEPTRILESDFAFWPSKVLLTAVKMELFTRLGERAMTGAALGRQLELHERGVWDFLVAPMPLA